MTARALALCLAIAVAAPACGDDAPPTGADTDTAQVVDADPDTGPAPDTTSDPDTSALPDADAGTDTDTDTVIAVDGAGDGHPPSCAVDADCDDGLACTVDRCTEARHCAWSVAAAACLVHAQCFAAGDARPGEPCQVCDPAAAPLAWTPRDDGAPCGGDDACTLPGTCSGGVCQVSDLPCDDRNPCTDDVCDPVVGCTSTASAADAPCDDGDPCTTGDRCDGAGACVVSPVACDDGDPCTIDACDAATGDCTHALAPGAPCEDGDPCTAGDACDAAGACVSGGPNPCDDGNPCTIDSCGAGGCAHLATQNACCAGVVSVCDDGNPCTDDSCDPATAGCTHTANTAACDDRNACTAGDACQDGACVPGAPVVCEPAGACTTAVCDRNAGCRVYPASGTPCDDGVACTTDDTCVSGACVGDDTDCACTPPIPPNAVRLTAMRLGGAGEGVDVDGDPATCEPSASCSGGVDNAFGTLGAVVNPSIQEAIDAGSLVLVLDLDALANGPATVAVHTGARAPGCAAEPCPYVLAATGFADPPLPTDPTCVPRFVLAGTWALPTLTAGGDDAVIPIELPLSAGASLSLTLRRAHLTGTVTVSGGAAATFSGVLAGAIAKGEVLAAIDGLTSFPAGLTRDQVKGLVSALVATDIDADGNGVAESSSIALVVEGVAVQIVEGTP